VATHNHVCKGEKPKVPACVHLGEHTGDFLPCDTCGTNADGTKKKTNVKVLGCAIFGECSKNPKITEVAFCSPNCGKYTPSASQ
jgi:hypothetical protein